MHKLMRTVAVFLALLTVTASVTPALAAGIASPPNEDSTASPPLSPSSAELRFGALERLNTSSFRKKLIGNEWRQMTQK